MKKSQKNLLGWGVSENEKRIMRRAFGDYGKATSEMRENIELIAESIMLSLPDPEIWKDLIIYLIKLLEKDLRRPEDFEFMLESLQSDLQDRIRNGEWI